MELAIKQTFDREICHFANTDTMITSSYNKVYLTKNGNELEIPLPTQGWKRAFGRFRLSRRALRLDKCNVVPVEDGLVIIRQGAVWRFDQSSGQVRPVLRLENCRNVLHQSIAVLDETTLYFGEYGSNAARASVPLHRSVDAGRTWDTVFRFGAGQAAHVHGCYFDPFEEKIWVFTGDFERECHVLCADRQFQNVEWIGDGSQTYRACNAFFEPDAVHWIMDSPLQDSYHIRLDRRTRTIERKQMFPGPVWYIKRLLDGYYLAATVQEVGPGVKDQYAHLMVSRDLEHWEDVHCFSHDGLPKRLFKFGVIGFPDGQQDSRSFYLFAEALQGLDGQTALCEIR